MTTIIYIIIAAVIGLAAGYIVRKQVGESKIKSAEEEAARIMEEATRNTDAIRKEAMLEAKEKGMIRHMGHVQSSVCCRRN